MDKYDEFLIALRELTMKYGVAIDGCGCCGSPYIVDVIVDRLIQLELNQDG